eukprot:GILJ01001535.1.p1 GENE.GILJ01001535.1~~GILJ01001535.1.p1  ORF type:complete len:567 (-),score=71.70 GILJ01001535.1:100-1728(-)
MASPAGVTVQNWTPNAQKLLTPDALEFLAKLHREFEPERQRRLQARVERQAFIDAGGGLSFLPETAPIRQGQWQVASIPNDLQKRWVEITGPTDRRMVINAMNSGANVFMADFEDALAPTWDNLLDGQANMIDANKGTITVVKDGKTVGLKPNHATLLIRPRGWHLDEKHVLVDGQPMSGSLFDFGLYMFHNAPIRLARQSAPYFYLPKLESHLEARLWNDVITRAEQLLNIPNCVRVTVLIETILGALEMEEMLYELRDHIVAFNAGRWDYLFSVIKKFRTRKDCILPDRVQMTMTTPFMRAYTERLVQVCHKHGAHAIGGMAAFIPSRRDAELNAKAIAKVKEDKEREVRDGFDGTWVAHPDLVATAQAVFSQHLGQKPHQKERMRSDVQVSAADLLDFHVDAGKCTLDGARLNVNVALQYINSWLMGVGAAAIHNLMEDAATAEISRAQLWQWLHNDVVLEGGIRFTTELYQTLRNEELQRLGGVEKQKLGIASQILDTLVLSPVFPDFLTTVAYDHITSIPKSSAVGSAPKLTIRSRM